MSHRLLLAAVAACGLFATQAYAGSPYYGAAGASAATPAGGAEDYRALAPQASAPATARAATSGPQVVLGPDGHLPVQSDSLYFRRASGSMGAP